MPHPHRVPRLPHNTDVMPSPHNLSGALFTAVHHGTRYTLVCLHDGRYALAADGHLLPPRWDLDNFPACFRSFMELTGRPDESPSDPPFANTAGPPLQ